MALLPPQGKFRWGSGRRFRVTETTLVWIIISTTRLRGGIDDGYRDEGHKDVQRHEFDTPIICTVVGLHSVGGGLIIRKQQSPVLVSVD